MERAILYIASHISDERMRVIIADYLLLTPPAEGDVYQQLAIKLANCCAELLCAIRHLTTDRHDYEQ